MPVLMYVNETMIWKEMYRSRIWVVVMDNLRGLLGIRRMEKVLNTQIRELCGVVKAVAKGLMEVFFDGLAMWREWRMTGLLRGSMKNGA